MSKSFSVTTMGCKVNTYDAGLLEKNLQSNGFALDTNDPQIHILNSCAVTERATLDAKKEIRRIKAKNPAAVVVLTGCVAQVDVERMTRESGADLIVGNSHKMHLPKILSEHLEQRSVARVHHSNIFKKDDLEAGGGEENSRTRSFLKIQDGCNSFCSFCIIPFARGKSRSVPTHEIVSRIQELEARGFREVVLTGVHCGDYDDGQNSFSDLVKEAINGTQKMRFRLSSLEPIEIDDKLWALFKSEPRLCPHLHMSIQSANSRVLREMKRKYEQTHIAQFFERLKVDLPHAFVGMDVIVGFPGETEDEFLDTYQFLANHPWTRIHVFPYSSRPGTAAARRSDHLEESVIHARGRRLRELSLSRHWERAEAQVGQVKQSLILNSQSHGGQGLTRDYWAVALEDDVRLRTNEEIAVEITGVLRQASGEPLLTAKTV
ncbi:MAG: tRNA (N(6)-L-threonylcarbamoyladenosine(37)-C(2))-methylthiotransferase MtaB [Oligoflexia bacterium]|nr:tRNA (N(6)-L-threonylcarbamoyladenosine(37)-C(2))-methylthiotransferase MtaB [Oligoflexia bacterium]